jgi:hypothetical protein
MYARQPHHCLGKRRCCGRVPPGDMEQRILKMRKDSSEHMAACHRAVEHFLADPACLVGLAQRPKGRSQENHRGDAHVLAEAIAQVAVALRIEHREGLPQVGAGVLKVPEIPLGHAGKAMRHGGFRRRRLALDVAQDDFGDCPQGAGLSAAEAPDPEAVIGREPFHWVINRGGQLPGASEGGRRFKRAVAVCRD